MTSEEESERRYGWHLERHIPLGILLVVLAGITGGAMWVAPVSMRVAANDDKIDRLGRTETDGARSSYDRLLTRLENVEANQKLVLYRLEQIEKAVTAASK